MGRRASREMAMKLLYQLEIQKDDREAQKERFFEENPMAPNDREYINDVIDGVFANKEAISRLIEKYSKGWKINRISKIDLSIMRLSIYEICYRSDIPYNVSVNEAVELAKRYSSEDAGSFINGILSKISSNDQNRASGTEDQNDGG
jgi:N utilization substance protein B